MSILERLRLRGGVVEQHQTQDSASKGERTIFEPAMKPLLPGIAEGFQVPYERAFLPGRKVKFRQRRKGNENGAAINGELRAIQHTNKRFSENLKNDQYIHAVSVLQNFLGQNIAKKEVNMEEVAKSLHIIITEDGILREKRFFNDKGKKTRTAQYPKVTVTSGQEEFIATSVDGVVFLTYYDTPGKQPKYGVELSLDGNSKAEIVTVRHRKTISEYYSNHARLLYARMAQKGVARLLSVLPAAQVQKSMENVLK